MNYNWLYKLLKPIIVAIAVAAFSSTSHADLASAGINLGRANNFTLFALTNGVQVTGGYNATMDVVGNIGAAGGNVSLTTATGIPYNYVLGVQGDVYLKTGATFYKDSKSLLFGSVIQNSTANSLLDGAATDASNASSYAFSLASTAGYPTSINLNCTNKTITGSGNVVLNLTDFQIKSGTLTLVGTANTSYIINVTKSFSLDNGDVVLSGGLLASNVLFNVKNGVSNVTLTNGSSLSGIVLATKSVVTVTNSRVNGKIIGKQVVLSGKSPVAVSP